MRAFWLKWRFHINILLLLVPLGFMPKYFADAALFRGDSGLGQREIGEVQVGPWSIRLAEFRNEAPAPNPAGPMKFFNAALCATCGDQVKATYLRIGKPRSLRAAGVIFFGTPYRMGHMDLCPLYEDCAFLEAWPGVPVGNEEGEIITTALGDKRAILLSHHGQLSTGTTIEEACVTAQLIERAAKLQLLAMAAGTVKPILPELGREAHDWISKPKRHGAAFNYYARQNLRQHADCLN